MNLKVEFTCEAHWEDTGLVIECPTREASEYVAHRLDKIPIILRVRKETGGRE